MARKTRKGLSDEDRALWQKVAETAKPLSRPRALPLPDDLDPQARPRPTPPKPDPVPRFRVGQSAPPSPPRFDLAPDPADRLTRQPPQMDRKNYEKLKRGKLRPEARIDLHGMTLAQAHPALTGFILRAHGDGKRVVLVITGKGRDSDEGGPIPVRRGILRHQVPHWLHSPPLGAMVLQVVPANRRHGGTGAYYVYLRRVRG